MTRRTKIIEEHFVQNFTNTADVLREYSAPAGALDGATVHLAWYGYGDYCGSSLVIFEKDGKLWEVNGSHCSCNGLEGLWEPEETSWEALAMRRVDSDCKGSGSAQAVLEKLIEKQKGSHA